MSLAGSTGLSGRQEREERGLYYHYMAGATSSSSSQRGLCRRRRHGRGGGRQNGRAEGFSCPTCVCVCVAGVELGLLELSPSHVSTHGVGQVFYSYIAACVYMNPVGDRIGQ